jgi:hypothetical protein
MKLANVPIDEEELRDCGSSRLIVHACREPHEVSPPPGGPPPT